MKRNISNRFILANYLGFLLTNVLNVVSLFFFSSKLSIALLGVYTLVLNIHNLYTLSLGKSLNQLFLRFFSQSRKNKETIIFEFTYVVIGIFLIAGIYLIACRFVYSFLDYYEAMVLFFLISSTILIDLVIQYYQILEDSRSYLFLEGSRSIFKFVSSILFYLIFRTAESIFVGLLFAQMLLVLILVVRNSRVITQKLFETEKKVSSNRVSQFIFYLLPFITWLILSQLINNGDRFLITKFFGIEQTGLFSLGLTLGAYLPSVIATPLINSFNPSFFHYSLSRESEKLKFIRLLNFTSALYVDLYLIFYSIFSLLIVPLLQLYFKGKFDASFAVIEPIMLFSFLWNYTSYGNKIFEVNSRVHKMLLCLFVSVVVYFVIFLLCSGHIVLAITIPKICSILIYLFLINKEFSRYGIKWLLFNSNVWVCVFLILLIYILNITFKMAFSFGNTVFLLRLLSVAVVIAIHFYLSNKMNKRQFSFKVKLFRNFISKLKWNT